MSSLIQGFEYDIFISYRQNDNKYDGWVTEFVNNLNKELEATLKDKVNVYFDANPHDGLLETHSVNHSLEAKLKCLIFIPILSKTYCDPKGFAWNHEFLAFIDQAGKDRFGLNVKLNSGNVSSRVLPVRIHDLDPEDVKLAESHLGVIRSVDFIYHSPGVNRSLRPWDDDVIKNTNTKQPYYRDQINKVANAVDELLRGIKHAEKNKTGIPVVPVPVEKSKAEKTPKAPRKNDTQVSVSVPKIIRWAAVIIVLGAVGFFGSKWYVRKRNVDHARTVLLPAIQKLVDENFRPPTQAFDMALEAEKLIPDDSTLIELLDGIVTTIPIETDPPGAEVFWKDYDKPNSEWRLAGVTPIKEARFAKPFLRVEIRKSGYQTIEFAGFIRNGSVIKKLKLDAEESVDKNMVRIPAKITDMYIVGLEPQGGKDVSEFLIDRYEVTNKEFKAFTEAGGYTNKTFWKYPFYVNGKEISFEEATKLFIDRTGRSGPSTWEAGTYVDGQENHPVTGVSWYEASAYAAFANKQLPTIFHWSVVAATSRTESIVPFSNYNRKSTVEVGSLPGYSTFGIYDLAGNAREWCFNTTDNDNQRFILGGGWNDPTYSFNDSYTQPAFDRSISNGFRCMKELPGDSTLTLLRSPVKMDFRDYKNEKPVDDKTFEIFRRQYSYDKTQLNENIEFKLDREFWTIEKITFDAGYNNERMDAYLYLPKNAKPPFQPIIFFPGSGDIHSTKFDVDEPMFAMDFLIKSGRAFVYPVYKGTHERHGELKSDLPNQSIFYKDHQIMWRKDVGRTIDYLETRSDIQIDKLGYLGWSWGGYMGGIIPALENRIKVIVLNVGGMVMQNHCQKLIRLTFSQGCLNLF